LHHCFRRRSCQAHLLRVPRQCSGSLAVSGNLWGFLCQLCVCLIAGVALHSVVKMILAVKSLLRSEGSDYSPHAVLMTASDVPCGLISDYVVIPIVFTSLKMLFSCSTNCLCIFFEVMQPVGVVCKHPAFCILHSLSTWQNSQSSCCQSYLIRTPHQLHSLLSELTTQSKCLHSIGFPAYLDIFFVSTMPTSLAQCNYWFKLSQMPSCRPMGLHLT